MNQSVERVGVRRSSPILFAIVVGVLLGAALSASTLGQSAETLAKIDSVKKELQEAGSEIDVLKPQVEAEKSEISEGFSKLFDGATRKELGELIASTITGCAASGASTTADTVLAKLDEKLTSTYGAEVVSATRSAFSEMITIILEEGGEPSPILCSKHLREAVELSFGSDDFERAWKSTLRGHAPKAQRLVALQLRKDKLDRELKTLNRMLSLNIRGVIPVGMAPVMGNESVTLGVTTEEIIRLATENSETVEKNHFLFSGSQTETVNVPSFLLDINEVTHLMFWHFVQETGHQFEIGASAFDGPRYFAGKDKRGNKIFKEVWPDGKIPEGWEHRPMTFVNYFDVVAYCKWTGTRLPTENEWEVAARSGEKGFDGRFWPYGSKYVRHHANDDQAHDVPARLRLRLPGDKFPPVLPVGSFPQGASPLGHLDLVGSVSEWTSSRFIPRKTFERTIKTKVDGKKIELHVPTNWSEDKRVIRGGHCNQRDLIASSVMRSGLNPYFAVPFVGFRRARSGIPGQDALNNIHPELDRGLQVFKMCKSEEKAGQPFPQIDRTPGTFAVLEKFDWNEKLQVPGKASVVLVANRTLDTKSCSSMKNMKRMSRGIVDVEDSLLLGVLHTDVPFKNPSLSAGTWFVAFKEGYKTKDENGKKMKVKDAFIFKPLAPNLSPVRLEAKGNEVLLDRNSLDTSVKRLALRDRDVLKVLYSFKKRKKSVTVELGFEAEKGALEGYE